MLTDAHISRLGYLLSGEDTLRVDAYFLINGEKNLRVKNKRYE